MTYKARIVSEEAVIRDGIYEMMHEVAFGEHAKKPKHFPPLGLAPEQGKSEFLRLSEAPDAMVDYNGPSEAYRLRVGIKVKDVVVMARAATC